MDSSGFIEDNHSKDSFYDTSNDELIAAAAIASIGGEEATSSPSHHIELAASYPYGNNSDNDVFQSGSSSRNIEEINQLREERDHWKGRAIFLEHKVAKLEQNDQQMHIDLARARNEVLSLRRQVEQERQLRDEKVNQMRTMMLFEQESQRAQAINEANVFVDEPPPTHQQKHQLPSTSSAAMAATSSATALRTPNNNFSPPLQRIRPHIHQQQQLKYSPTTSQPQKQLQQQKLVLSPPAAAALNKTPQKQQPTWFQQQQRMQEETPQKWHFDGPNHIAAGGSDETEEHFEEMRTSARMFVQQPSFPSPTESFGPYASVPPRRRRGRPASSDSTTKTADQSSSKAKSRAVAAPPRFSQRRIKQQKK